MNIFSNRRSMIWGITLLIIIGLLGCDTPDDHELKTGFWTAAFRPIDSETGEALIDDLKITRKGGDFAQVFFFLKDGEMFIVFLGMEKDTPEIHVVTSIHEAATLPGEYLEYHSPNTASTRTNFEAPTLRMTRIEPADDGNAEKPPGVERKP